MGVSAYNVVTRVKGSLPVLPSLARGQTSSLDSVSLKVGSWPLKVKVICSRFSSERGEKLAQAESSS